MPSGADRAYLRCAASRIATKMPDDISIPMLSRRAAARSCWRRELWVWCWRAPSRCGRTTAPRCSSRRSAPASPLVSADEIASMTARTARLLLALGAFVAGLVLFSAVIFIVTGRSPAPIAMTSAVGGPFKLVDQNAKPITDQDLKGEPFLVFFGFTHCPDVCPTTLFDVSEIIPRARPRCRQASARCSSPSIPSATRPPCMKDYLSSFDPRIIGVTGDDAAIAAAEKAYRVYAKKVPHRRRQLHHGPHRDRLSDEQGRPLRRAVQHEAQAGRGRRRSQALSLILTPSREVRARPCSVFSQR